MMNDALEGHEENAAAVVGEKNPSNQ